MNIESTSRANPRAIIKSTNWMEIRRSPDKCKLEHFHNALIDSCNEDVNGGFRIFSAELLDRGLISMQQYVSVFGGEALHHMTLYDGNAFRHMDTGKEASELTAIYSRAKYGSIADIRLLAEQVVEHLSKALNKPDSQWSRLFNKARINGESVALMTTGWRNVPSMANVLYTIVVDRINLKLAHLGLPTVINVKLPRIAPPCENYASLTTKERARVNLVQDHVIPDRNFYQWSGVHVIFGDDVLVTGSTADKVFFESMRNGAKSFQAIYPVAMDPRLAFADAAIEERLNMVAVTGQLDDMMAIILAHRHYQPILRTLRLVFAKANHENFRGFVPRVPIHTWLNLYTAALGNEFLQQDDCKQSLLVLKDYLIDLKLLSADGTELLP